MNNVIIKNRKRSFFKSIIWTFEKQASGLKTGLRKFSEIR